MGLNQADADPQQTSRFRIWIVPGLILIGALLLELSGDAGRELLRYDRTAIAGGELWRLISGHVAHLGWSHFALNAVGMLLIFYLVGDRFSPASWLLACLFIALGIDLGFWLLEPQLIWYVGLSGLLHGCFAAGAVDGLRHRRFEEMLMAGLLVLKLAYEQFAGPLPGSENTAGGNVVVAAHLYGAIAGFLIGALLLFRKPTAAPI
ncbi:MAG: rhombosortase [Woeseiaceae bacterium]